MVRKETCEWPSWSRKSPAVLELQIGAMNFCRVQSYLSTARKQGYPLLHSLERVLNGKPLIFQ
jgi:hypothetical protein